MHNKAISGPFRPAAIPDPAGLLQVLQDAEYTPSRLARLLRQGSGESNRPLLARSLSGDTPFHVAARLFLLGESVSDEAIIRLLPPGHATDLQAAGVLSRRGGRWRAAAQLAPAFEGRIHAWSDFAQRGSGLAPDHVLGVGSASETLAALTPRRRFHEALDLGCGAGVQALLAAAHCDRVCGADINRRALNFAAANARLNGIGNVEWLEGDFFEPVAGRRFDLIVANPPFVISPEHQFIFRTGTAAGDGVSERVVRETPVHLAEDGLAVILINWGHRDEEDWAERPMRWMEANGCDTWLMQFRSDEPLAYAAEWLRVERTKPQAYGRALDHWMEYYRQLGIGWISAGAVVLRRRAKAAQRWVRCDSLAFGRHSGECGAHLERVIAGETWAQRIVGDQAMLEQRFQLHQDHIVETHFKAEGGGWQHGPLTLRPAPGLAFAGSLDTQVMQVLAALDGRRTLGDVVTACAAANGLDAAGMAMPCAAVARKLLRAGLLVPGAEGN